MARYTKSGRQEQNSKFDAIIEQYLRSENDGMEDTPGAVIEWIIKKRVSLS